MASNVRNLPARQLEFQATHFMRKTIVFSENSGIVGILPAGAIVLRGNVYVFTGFNDTNGDDLDVGVQGDDDDLFASALDLNSAAIVAFDDLAIANARSASQRVVTWNYTTAATGDGTAGEAVIELEFIPDNDG